MDKRDLDAQAVGFFQGVAFATDLFKDIDAIPSREIRDLVFDLMVTKIDDERTRMSKDATTILDEIDKLNKKKMEGG